MQPQVVNRVCICLTVLLSIVSGVFADPPPGNWTLTWSDEFDSGSTPQYPNPANWSYEEGYKRNQEWQYYTNALQNAYCQDGLLHIEAHQHPVGTYPTGSYTGQDGSISSASLRTNGKVEVLYGWLEMRARIDTRLGSWPAFWTVGANGSWPDAGECDIMEYYRDMLRFNVAWWKTGDPAWTPRWDGTIAYVSDFGPTWADEFHIWGMEWTPERVNLYLDGVIWNTWDSSLDSGDNSIEAFQNPHVIILNQAIGGNNGGDASGLSYPTHYEIDYVRWYEGSATPPTGDIEIINPSFEEPGTVKQSNWESVPGWSSDTVASESGVETGGIEGLWQGYLKGSDPAVWQLTNHVLAAGETIELSVNSSITWLGSNLTMALYYDNGGSRVTAASQQVALTPAWQVFTLTLNADDVPGAIGKQIGILLDNPSTGADWIGFDNVILLITSGGGPDTTPPAAPTGLIATAGDGSVTLDWANNAESDLEGYQVYRSTTSGSGYVSIISGLTASYYVDDTVVNDTTYYYVVTAADTSSNESSYSNEDSATPQAGVDLPPAAPTGLAATAGNGSVSLDWADNTEPDLMHYDVYRSTTSGSGYVSIISGQATSDYVDNGVTNGTTYYYVVTAVDAGSNESGNSNESSATPEAPCVSTASHVESIVCTIASGSRGQKYGQVTVTIYDNCGNPVAGANVTGTFTGSYNQTRSGTTNAGGTVVLTTTTQVKKPAYTFCVDTVVSGLTYDAAANTVTCGSY